MQRYDTPDDMSNKQTVNLNQLKLTIRLPKGITKFIKPLLRVTVRYMTENKMGDIFLQWLKYTAQLLNESMRL